MKIEKHINKILKPPFTLVHPLYRILQHKAFQVRLPSHHGRYKYILVVLFHRPY